MTEKKWSSPPIIIALAGLFVSVGTNLYQYNSNNKKLEFEKKKWVQEFNQLREEYELKIEERDRQDEQEVKLEKELEQINSDIAVWNEGLENSKAKLFIIKNKLFQAKEGPNKEALQQNIVLLNDLILNQENELEKLKERRLEIEKIRFTCK